MTRIACITAIAALVVQVTSATALAKRSCWFKNCSDSDIIGKVIAGYQGWFAVQQDQVDPRKKWAHWGYNGTIPGITFELWPDVTEYEQSYQWNTNATLGDGEPATLFDSYDNSTVDLHFQWMKEYNVDVAALQRFGTNLYGTNGTKQHMDGVFLKARHYAEKHDVKFFTFWDISGWDNFTTALPLDWYNFAKELTNSPAYARHEGKPVVCVWGMGISNRPGTPDQIAEIIEFLQSEGCYVIGGTGWQWRTYTDFLPAFNKLDMITPWTVGGYNLSAGAYAYGENTELGDVQYCQENDLEYLPVMWPGYAVSNWQNSPRNWFPREYGTLLWAQFVNAAQLNVSTAYIAMFDEFDEATAILKAATNSSMIPTDQYFLTLDADGVEVSSDFYLRVVQDGRSMLQGRSPITSDCPTPFI
jgi:hypothetical protein